MRIDKTFTDLKQKRDWYADIDIPCFLPLKLIIKHISVNNYAFEEKSIKLLEESIIDNHEFLRILD